MYIGVVGKVPISFSSSIFGLIDMDMSKRYMSLHHGIRPTATLQSHLSLAHGLLGVVRNSVSFIYHTLRELLASASTSHTSHHNNQISTPTHPLFTYTTPKRIALKQSNLISISIPIDIYSSSSITCQVYP